MENKQILNNENGNFKANFEKQIVLDIDMNNNNEHNENLNDNENPNNISEEYVDNPEFEIDEEDLIDNDLFEYAANAIDSEAIDVKDTAMHIESEACSESSINITNEFDNFKAEGEIYSLALTEKGILVMGDGEEYTYFYDISMKKLIKKEKFNKDSVNNIKITVDGKYVLTSSLDGTVNVFSSESFELLRTVEGSFSEINWLEVHPKGPVFAFGTVDASVWVYHAQNSETNMSFFGHTEAVSCGSFSSDGKYLVTGSEDTTVKIWDLKNNCLANTIKGKKFHKSPILTLAMAKKKNIIATGSMDNELAVSNAENGNVLVLLSTGSQEHSIESISFFNEDKFLIFAGTEPNIQILDLSLLQIRIKFDLKNETISKLMISTQQNYLVYMSGSHGNFYVFDTRGNGSISQKEKVHSDVIMDFHITKDENFAITSSLDQSINLVKIVNL